MPWRTITDSIEHYKIFLTLSDYNNEKITKEIAKEQLGRINYVFKDLKENIRSTISEIMKEEKIEKPITKSSSQKKYSKGKYHE